MRRRTMVALVIALGGCAPPAATMQGRTTPEASHAEPAVALAADRDALEREHERVRELEAALGLARAEARDLRVELREREAAERVRATRIGTPRCDEPSLAVAGAPEVEEDRHERARPVLRLYGEPEVAAIPGPVAPPIADAPPPPSIRLPVMMVPGADPEAGVPAIPSAPIAVAPRVAAEARPAPPADDGTLAEYRAALAHLAARRLDEALAGLDAFLRAHPRHPYADNALYWRAEIHYARRDYRSALASLAALIERYPNGNKVPDALLRIGLCHERMGDRARARQVFERLRTQYPDSVAARMASREDV